MATSKNDASKAGKILGSGGEATKDEKLVAASDLAQAKGSGKKKGK